MPKVSVIMPTYNRAEFIGAAIDSVLGQTYPDLELIVVDDGSTDDTAAIVAARQDARLRYIQQANAGETAARNTGIAHATGALIGFLDSDDVMLPHNLETLAGTLDARPDVDVAYGWFYFMHADGTPIRFVHGEITGEIPAQRDVVWPQDNVKMSGTCMQGKIFEQVLLDREGTLAIGAAVVRRACIDKIGGFDPARKHQGHWDFYLRLAHAGCVYACTRQAVLLVRQHSGGAHKQLENMFAARLKILDGVFTESQPAGLREKAYRNTNVYYANIFLNNHRPDRAVECINEAVRYGGPLDAATLHNTVHTLVSQALNQTEMPPLESLERQIAPVKDAQTAKYLSRTTTAIMSHHLAFEARNAGRSRDAIKYALLAIQSRPAFLVDRGLARVAMQAMLGLFLLTRIDWPTM